MHVSVRAVDFVLTHPLRIAVEERLACALAWTGRKLARLGVLLSYVAGPGGQRLTRCTIEVDLQDGGKLLAQDTRADFHLAAELAAGRIDRLLRQAARRQARPRLRGEHGASGGSALRPGHQR